MVFLVAKFGRCPVDEGNRNPHAERSVANAVALQGGTSLTNALILDMSPMTLRPVSRCAPIRTMASPALGCSKISDAGETLSLAKTLVSRGILYY